MRKIIIALSAFLLSCGIAQEAQVVEVDSVACISHCAWNHWSGGIDKDKLPGCEKVFHGKRCCAFQFTNSGSNIDATWTKGQIGGTTTCPPKVKP